MNNRESSNGIKSIKVADANEVRELIGKYIDKNKINYLEQKVDVEDDLFTVYSLKREMIDGFENSTLVRLAKRMEG